VLNVNIVHILVSKVSKSMQLNVNFKCAQ